MIKKQNLWLLTLFSLILILGVYYVTMPNEVLEKINIKTEELKEDKVEEESSLTSLRVSKETTRKEKIDSLESSLASDNLTSSEKKILMNY